MMVSLGRYGRVEESTEKGVHVTEHAIQTFVEPSATKQTYGTFAEHDQLNIMHSLVSITHLALVIFLHLLETMLQFWTFGDKSARFRVR